MFQVTHKTIDELHLQNRTSAYRWLWRNYEAITVRRGFWLGLADKLASEGIVRTDRDGRMVPYDPEALRQTFNRVKADKAMTGMPGRKTSPRPPARRKPPLTIQPSVLRSRSSQPMPIPRLGSRSHVHREGWRRERLRQARPHA